MKLSCALSSLWFHPRKAIKEIIQSYTFVRDFQALALLTLTVFLQMGLLMWMIDVIPGTYFFSAKGIQTIGWSFVVVSVGLFTYANLTALIVWKIANLLKGQGSLANTRTGVLWSLIGFIPSGFSILLVYFAYNLKVLEKSIFLLDVISLLLFPLAFVYGIFLSVKIISEIHSLSFGSSCFTLVLCGIIQIGCVCGFVMLMNN